MRAVRNRAGIRQLSECLHQPHSARRVGRQSSIPLPHLRRSHPLVRQSSAAELAVAASPLPDCGWRIPWRYPVVELLTAVLFVACLVWFGPTWLTLKFCVFSFLILGLIFMDAETGLLPREFTYPGIALGLAFSWIAPTDSAGTQFLLSLYNQYWGNVQRLSLLDSALGAAVGAGFLYVAWGLYYLVRKKHGMGFGDIALLAMSGAFLGLKLTLFVIFTAPLLALICTMLLLVSGAGGSRSADASQGEVKVRRRESIL